MFLFFYYNRLKCWLKKTYACILVVVHCNYPLQFYSHSETASMHVFVSYISFNPCGCCSSISSLGFPVVQFLHYKSHQQEKRGKKTWACSFNPFRALPRNYNPHALFLLCSLWLFWNVWVTIRIENGTHIGRTTGSHVYKFTAALSMHLCTDKLFIWCVIYTLVYLTVHIWCTCTCL